MIGLGGLGNFVYQGTSSNNNTLILLGLKQINDPQNYRANFR